MLFAFWRMSSTNDCHERYINARAYKKLREEYALNVGSLTCITQAGKKNSQWGKHWFTDLRTGVCKSLKEKPDEFWIEGRNWFKNEGKTLYSIYSKHKLTNGAIEKRVKRDKLNKQKKTKSIEKHENYIFFFDKVKHKTIKVLPSTLEKHYKETCLLWDEFHTNNYKELSLFAKKLNITRTALFNRFKKYIPYFSILLNENKHKHIHSNKDLIGKYE